MATPAGPTAPSPPSAFAEVATMGGFGKTSPMLMGIGVTAFVISLLLPGKIDEE